MCLFIHNITQPPRHHKHSYTTQPVHAKSIIITYFKTITQNSKIDMQKLGGGNKMFSCRFKFSQTFEQSMILRCKQLCAIAHISTPPIFYKFATKNVRIHFHKLIRNAYFYINIGQT